jgi:hypothetical protein
MSEDKFEEFLRREAKGYNAPPLNVPREEMFAAIQDGRRQTADGSRDGGRQKWTPRVAWIGMAATLLIGVAIGKYAMSRGDVPTAIVAAAPTPGDASASLRHADTANVSYTRAANAELVRAEALLTAYGASPANSGMDKQLSGWARDVLSNTRLLLDSPAADDPARKRLLQDLELVLVQMVQRSPTAGAGEERAHIDRSLDRTQVLTRLRSALPATRNN